MAFIQRTDWRDDEAGGTPIMAADMLRIEQGVADAQNPSLAPVATSGSYTDLSNKPTLYTDTQAKAAVAAATTMAPTGVWNFSQSPQVNGVPITGGGGSVSDATTTTKGVVQLAGDLAGTAAAPTVPNKLGRKNTSTNISPAATDYWQHVEILDDGTATASWPNRVEFAYTPQGGSRGLTTYLNEYGELRVEPAKATTVAARFFTKHAPTDPTHTANVFEVMDDRTTRTVLASIDASGNLTAANLPKKITVASTAPNSPSVNDLWVDLSS